MTKYIAIERGEGDRKEKRRDEKKPVAVLYDVGDLDDIDGGAVDVFHAENCPRALFSKPYAVHGDADSRARIIGNERRVHFLFLAERREGFYLRGVVLSFSP